MTSGADRVGSQLAVYPGNAPRITRKNTVVRPGDGVARDDGTVRNRVPGISQTTRIKSGQMDAAGLTITFPDPGKFWQYAVRFRTRRAVVILVIVVKVVNIVRERISGKSRHLPKRRE